MCCVARAVCVSLTSARYLHCTSHRACALFPAGRSHALAMNFFHLTARTRVLQRLSRTLGDEKSYAGGQLRQPSHQKQRTLSIQGVCKHRNDQVCMIGRLRVHGCVCPVHTIVPFTPDRLVQCMHDAAIR